MQETGFRAGQWVVYGDKVGLLYRRDEFRRDAQGRIVDRDGTPVDTTGGIVWNIVAASETHIDFHPVDDNGETITAAIVPDVIVGMTVDGDIVPPQMGARRAIAGSAPIGLRPARYEEIPQARRDTGDVHAFKRYEYEGAPEPPVEGFTGARIVAEEKE